MVAAAIPEGRIALQGRHYGGGEREHYPEMPLVGAQQQSDDVKLMSKSASRRNNHRRSGRRIGKWPRPHPNRLERANRKKKANAHAVGEPYEACHQPALQTQQAQHPHRAAGSVGRASAESENNNEASLMKGRQRLAIART